MVGLGNPGPRYERTRHNMGFMTLDGYAQRQGLAFRRTRYGQVAETPWGWMLKPETFMNLSGRAVAPFMEYYRLPLHQLLVVVDDLDLPLGSLRLRRGGSSGGHNGLKSIAGCLGTDQFARLKLGISRPPDPIRVIDWVLMRFTPSELVEVDRIVTRATECLDAVRMQGYDWAMSRFNG